MRRKIVLTLLAAMMGLALAAPALAAPGPGDQQCRGATGNNNPHCPPGK